MTWTCKKELALQDANEGDLCAPKRSSRSASKTGNRRGLLTLGRRRRESSLADSESFCCHKGKSGKVRNKTTRISVTSIHLRMESAATKYQEKEYCEYAFSCKGSQITHVAYKDTCFDVESSQACLCSLTYLAGQGLLLRRNEICYN